jgi:hypothetical protein
MNHQTLSALDTRRRRERLEGVGRICHRIWPRTRLVCPSKFVSVQRLTTSCTILVAYLIHRYAPGDHRDVFFNPPGSFPGVTIFHDRAKCKGRESE